MNVAPLFLSTPLFLKHMFLISGRCVLLETPDDSWVTQ